MLVLVELDERELSAIGVEIVGQQLGHRQAQNLSLLDRVALAGDDRLVGAALIVVILIIVLSSSCSLRMGSPSLM